MHYVPKVMSQLLVSIVFGFGLSCISVFVNWLEWWTTVSVITTISLIHQYSIPVAQRLYRKRCWNILKTGDVVGIIKRKTKTHDVCSLFRHPLLLYLRWCKGFFLLCRSKVQRVWLTSSTSLNWSQGCGDITVNVWRSPYSDQALVFRASSVASGLPVVSTIHCLQYRNRVKCSLLLYTWTLFLSATKVCSNKMVSRTWTAKGNNSAYLLDKSVSTDLCCLLWANSFELTAIIVWFPYIPETYGC